MSRQLAERQEAHTETTHSGSNIYTLIKNRVGDDGVPAILQYRQSDQYLMGRMETMTIYPHSSPHLQIRTSLVHPFLPQDLDVPCKALVFYKLGQIL